VIIILVLVHEYIVGIDSSSNDLSSIYFINCRDVSYSLYWCILDRLYAPQYKHVYSSSKWQKQDRQTDRQTDRQNI